MSIRFFPNRLGRDPGSGLVEVPTSRVGPYDTLVIVVDRGSPSIFYVRAPVNRALVAGRNMAEWVVAVVADGSMDRCLFLRRSSFPLE